MNEEALISVSHIIAIEIYDKRECAYYKWYNERPQVLSRWGRIMQVYLPAGFYQGSQHGSNFIEEESLKKSPQYLIEGQKVLWAPKIIIVSTGGKYTREETAYFKTYADAKAYVDTIGETFSHIKVKTVN